MAEIRNVVLVGHSGSGKTTLAEHLLHRCGATTRIGTVEDGTTICDVDPIERRVGHSVALSVATTELRDSTLTGPAGPVQLTILDTPGHADFVGELRAGLRAADAAVFVISAVDGVHGSARVLWRECEAVGMPRAIAITHLDQTTSSWEETLAACRQTFGDGVHALYLPSEDGLLDVVRRAGTTDDAALATVDQLRGALIEEVITESDDDALMERYLSGDPVDFEDLIDDLEAAVAQAHFHPVLPVTMPAGVGLDELLEVICRGFPKPSEHVMPPVTTPDGRERPPITGSTSEPLVAEVIKTTTDAYVGRVSLVRIFAGTLRAEQAVHVSGHFARFSGHADDAAWHADHDVDEKAGTLSTVFGDTLTPVEEAAAGQIVAIARLSRAETGDTLSDPEAPALMEPWTMPEPLLPTAISAASNRDETKLAEGLARVQAEDPTVRLVVDPGTHQMVLWTMGDQHRDVLLERLETRFGAAVSTDPVAVALQCTVRGRGAATGRHVKQSGGHGQYAVCDLEIEPLPLGSGVQFMDKVVGGAVPRQFIGSVEKGVRNQLAEGVGGHPMVDVQVSVVGGKHHSVDSSDAAFQTAGAIAVQSAAADAGVQLLEPVDVVTVSCEEAHVGAILSDLAARRGRVRGTEPDSDGQTTVTAEVPAIELLQYAPQLRALAHGTGRFRREYLAHSPAPEQVAQKLAATTP